MAESGGLCGQRDIAETLFTNSTALELVSPVRAQTTDQES